MLCSPPAGHMHIPPAAAYECTVRQVEGVQPMVTIEDCVEAEELVKADKGIRALLKDRYGITDMNMVAADPWFYGDRYGKRLWSPFYLCLCIESTWAGGYWTVAHPAVSLFSCNRPLVRSVRAAVEASGAAVCAALTYAPAGAAEDSKFQEGRIIQCFMYLRVGSAQDNHYAHPLDLLVYLDMNSGRVLDTWMYPEPPAIPQMKANYVAPLVQKERGFRIGAAMPFCHSEVQDCVRLKNCAPQKWWLDSRNSCLQLAV